VIQGDFVSQWCSILIVPHRRALDLKGLRLFFSKLRQGEGCVLADPLFFVDHESLERWDGAAGAEPSQRVGYVAEYDASLAVQQFKQGRFGALAPNVAKSPYDMAFVPLWFI
jgi:hypothetical protein